MHCNEFKCGYWPLSLFFRRSDVLTDSNSCSNNKHFQTTKWNIYGIALCNCFDYPFFVTIKYGWFWHLSRSARTSLMLIWWTKMLTDFKNWFGIKRIVISNRTSRIKTREQKWWWKISIKGSYLINTQYIQRVSM